jgi:hypothetical protein
MYGLIAIDCAVGISPAGAWGGWGSSKKEGNAMQRARGIGLALAVSFGIALGTLPLSIQQAAAQRNHCGNGTLLAIPICSNNAGGEGGEGGEAEGGNGGNGGAGGFASVHDIANAVAAATSSVTVGDITTGNAFGHSIVVDARGGEDPSTIAGSFSDTGVDIFAPGGNAQAGTTGGYGIAADGSGGDGGNGGNASGGNGGNGGKNDSCTSLLGCFDSLL